MTLKGLKMDEFGFDKLFKKMDDLSGEITQGKTDSIWRNALVFGFQPVLEESKSRAPYDTGQLAEHLYIKAHKPQARDKASLSYRGEMYMARVTLNPKRDDSTVRTVLNKRGKFQSIYTNRPVGLAMEFGTARDAAKPFLRPSLEHNIDTIQNRLAQSVWASIDKLAKG